MRQAPQGRDGMSEKKDSLKREKLWSLIRTRLAKPKKVSGCVGWLGQSKEGQPFIKLKLKNDKSKTVDIARFILEGKLERSLEASEGISRADACKLEECLNPDHLELAPAPSKQRSDGVDLQKVSAFKQAVKDGARVRAVASEYDLSISWAYQIATGKRYAEVTPKGAVLQRVKHTLTPEQVALAKRLRQKNKTKWTYQRIAKKLGCHYSTARDACTLERKSWDATT